ncbi:MULTISPECIES: hypothetical protein [unclassified Crossiella]|uniref:hypothetical protein n=1 Tax=unclassified Crossiella TaxID=2620835 RepID=UPI001FFEF5E9|nr:MULTISPECIES: hypothetical protein [unclassified Crossiella]MCK2242405.1 hypothetical protein [Crossiella sp. S99.2]MCK2254564.1 hypothetical protein [Crossiella sp. S99.1]
MSIDDVMARVTEIPGVLLGRGPAHPAEPDRSLAEPVRSFLEAYPALQQDQCYVEFLERYAGLAIESSDDTIFVDVLGFSEVALDIVNTEGPIVSNGFLMFAQCVYHQDEAGRSDTYEFDFAFDVSGERRSGVYRTYSTMETEPSPYEWHLDGFCSWLNELVDVGGVYARPSAS